jgi:hypothetical protein
MTFSLYVYKELCILLEKIFSKEKGGISVTKERKIKRKTNFQKKKKKERNRFQEREKKKEFYFPSCECNHEASTNTIFIFQSPLNSPIQFTIFMQLIEPLQLITNHRPLITTSTSLIHPTWNACIGGKPL